MSNKNEGALLPRAEILWMAVDAGFVIRKGYGSSPDQATPVSDASSLLAFARLVENDARAATAKKDAEIARLREALLAAGKAIPASGSDPRKTRRFQDARQAVQVALDTAALATSNDKGVG